MTVVLASGSPQRLALLREHGVSPLVEPADVDERELAGEAPRAVALRLATTKAGVVAGRRPGAVVLGSDTVVDLDGTSLGKPADAQEAAAMVRRLSGAELLVHSGVAVVRDDDVRAGVVTTRQHLRPLDDAEVLAYVATGEWRGAAGGFRIQGRGASLMAGGDGCWSNVVGLPTCLAADLLAHHDVAMTRDDCPPRA